MTKLGRVSDLMVVLARELASVEGVPEVGGWEKTVENILSGWPIGEVICIGL